jgi:hypothetical protein
MSISFESKLEPIASSSKPQKNDENYWELLLISFRWVEKSIKAFVEKLNATVQMQLWSEDKAYESLARQMNSVYQAFDSFWNYSAFSSFDDDENADQDNDGKSEMLVGINKPTIDYYEISGRSALPCYIPSGPVVSSAVGSDANNSNTSSLESWKTLFALRDMIINLNKAAYRSAEGQSGSNQSISSIKIDHRLFDYSAEQQDSADPKHLKELFQDHTSLYALFFLHFTNEFAMTQSDSAPFKAESSQSTGAAASISAAAEKLSNAKSIIRAFKNQSMSLDSFQKLVAGLEEKLNTFHTTKHLTSMDDILDKI